MTITPFGPLEGGGGALQHAWSFCNLATILCAHVSIFS